MNKDIEQKYSIQPFLAKFKEVLTKKIGNKEKPLILLQGGFGKHNTGDDTLMLVARQEILKIYPNARIYALCHNPEFLKQDYGVDGIKFKSAETFKYLLKCDALVVPAGGLVNNIDFNSYIKSLLNPRGKFVFVSMLTTIIRRKCTVVFGVGMHDMPDFIVKALVKLTIPRVDLLGVRDKHTVELVKDLGCKDFYFSHDPVIIYRQQKQVDWEEYKKEKNIPFDKFIVINFRMTKNAKDTHNAMRELAKYMGYMSKKYPEYGIVMMPFSLHPSFELENDIVAMNKLINLAKERCGAKNIVLLENYQTADDVKIIASHASLLVLTRHHAPVITYSCQVPTVVVSYNFKCREFAELGEYKYIEEYSELSYKGLAKITEQEL